MRTTTRFFLAGSTVLLVAALVGPVAVGSGAGSAAIPSADASTSWTVYHGNALGTGVDTSGVTFSPPSHAWTSPVLDGSVYGEPLVTGGRVFVATENDTVYALAANNGSILWSTHVGSPVPSGDIQCGDIDPDVGITGTPVIDTGRGEVYAVADELVSGSPHHFLVGLNIFSGAQELNLAADPPGSTPEFLLQRTGLNLDGGNVVFGYGGNAGDCGSYHGWIASAPEAGNTVTYLDTTGGVPNGTQGAVWMGGAAPEVDSGGNIWASTGNGSSNSSSYDGSDSVIELSSALNQEQLFAPSGWASDNSSDHDLGSTAPALLSNGTALQVGKSNTGYLLNQSHLGGIGGQLTTAAVCPSNDADGGDAVLGTVVFVPCMNGVQAIQTSPSPSLSVAWSASHGVGPPIIAGGLVWSIGGGNLYGLDPSTGSVSQQVSLGSQANHFPTPSVGDGLLLAPTSDQVVAFSGSAGVPAPPSPPPTAPPNASYWMVASDGGIFSFGNAQFFGSTGNLVLNKPVVGMASTSSGNGYWFVASDGGIFNYGGASFLGSMGGTPLNAPVVGMAALPSGTGYWEVASDGGIFSFGQAKFYGSMGATPLNKPIVGMATTHDGLGYWLVASDGGIFSFGDAAFHGSMGGTPLNRPVVGMAATPDGLGYWMVASDGGIFTFGDGKFLGSTGAITLNKPVVGMAPTNDGGGYWLVASDGGIFNYGDAGFSGSMGGTPLNRPVVGMASPG